MESSERLRVLATRFGQVSIVLGPTQIREEVELLERQVSDQGLWDNQEKAKKVTSELARKRQLLVNLVEIERFLEDTAELLSLASQEGDSSTAAEVDIDIAKIEAMLTSLETETLLSGEYDSRSAVMSIRSGAGGDDATDFSEMLMRM